MLSGKESAEENSIQLADRSSAKHKEKRATASSLNTISIASGVYSQKVRRPSRQDTTRLSTLFPHCCSVKRSHVSLGGKETGLSPFLARKGGTKR